MRKLLNFLIIILFFTFVNAFKLKANNTIDSLNKAMAIPDSIYNEILEQSAKMFSNLLKKNQTFFKEGKSDSLQYILNLGFDVTENSVVPFYSQQGTQSFVDNVKSDQINTALSAIKDREGVAPYLLFVTLNYKLKLAISETETITNIIDYDNAIKAGKKNEQIVYLKDFQARMGAELAKQLQNEPVNSWILTNVGNYIQFYPTGSVSQSLLFGNTFKNVDFASDFNKLMLSKLNGGAIWKTNNEAADNFVGAINNSIVQARIKAKILATTDRVELCNLLSTLTFPISSSDYTSSAYRALSLEERVHCMKIIIAGNRSPLVPAGGYGGYDISLCLDAESPKLLALLRNTPTDDIEKVFATLKEVIPNSSTQTYLYRMIDNTSNGFFGIGDTYTKFVKVIYDLFDKSPSLKDKANRIYKNIDSLLARTVGFGVNNSGQPVGTIVMGKAITLENGKISVERRVITKVSETVSTGFQFGPYTTTVPATTDLLDNPTYDPLDLIVFTNYSNLVVVKENFGTTTGEEQFVPALFLPYLKSKNIQNNIETGIITAIDVATIAVAAPEFIAATSWGRRAWAGFDLLNAGVNIAANNTSLANNPSVRAVLDKYNLVSAVIGGASLLRNSTGGYKNFGEYVQDAKKQVILDDGKVNNIFFSKVDDFENDLEDLFASGVVTDASQQQQLLRLEEKIEACIGGSCFVEGTKISLENATKPIEQIQKGDIVLSYDVNTSKNVFQKVKKTFKKLAKSLIYVILATDTIVATPEHPFYTENGFQALGTLHAGDKILEKNGTLATIDKIFKKDTIVTVYNLEVENTHNYFVGDKCILVHNSCKNSTNTLVDLDDIKNNKLSPLRPSVIGGRRFSASQFADFGLIMDRASISTKYPSLLPDFNQIVTFGDPTGALTESLMNKAFDLIGFQAKDAKLPSNNGLDGLFIPKTASVASPTRILIGEGKPFSYGLVMNPASSTLPIQGSNLWIDNVADRLINSLDPTLVQNGYMVKNNSSIIEFYGFAVDRNVKNPSLNIIKINF